MGEREAEKQTADAFEQLVHRDSFGELLARTTENVMGLTKIGFDALDLVVRNLRLAGRPDLLRLGKQLARNEDKLERVLQEVEQLQQQVGELETSKRTTSAASRRRGGASSSKNGSNARRRKSSSGSGAKS
jgi:hypothetical protein